jgi:hypothetical protein
MSKGVPATYPYEGYRVYKVYHKRIDRYMAILFESNERRTSTAWAKYVYETHHKVKLPKGQQVDHRDENRLNDDISNLQVLTKKDNIEKNVATRPPRKTVDLVCPVCQQTFTRRIGQTNLVPCRKNQRRVFCSRVCIGKAYEKHFLALAA